MAMVAATVGVVIAAGIGMDRPASTVSALLADSVAATAAPSKAEEAFTVVVEAFTVVAVAAFTVVVAAVGIGKPGLKRVKRRMRFPTDNLSAVTLLVAELTGAIINPKFDLALHPKGNRVWL